MAKKTTTAPETRAFKMHPKLLLDVIQRQAGRLSKAVLEGVMNAIDAGATQVDIDVSDKHVIITDDGKGFRNRQEIETFFEVFGQPHEETEKKVFGCFRMGRGQLFAFGKNSWTTNRFQMKVDIQDKGLDYELHEKTIQVRGCRIRVELYNPLSLLDQREIEDELVEIIRYVQIPVRVNDKQINLDPRTEQWSEETDEAWFFYRSSGSLKLYNLGVQVTDIAGHRQGVSGVVVTKKQLKLNFARNDVISTCPVWQGIRAVLAKRAGRAKTKKLAMSDDERIYLCRSLRADPATLQQVWDSPILTDVRGRHWSFQDLFYRHAAAYRYNHSLSCGPLHDRRADQVMSQKLALVLAQDTLDRLGLADSGQLLELVGRHQPPVPWKVVQLEQLTAGLDDRCALIPEAEHKPVERALLDVLITAMHQLTRDGGETRRLILGESETADGWTDGTTYIAINRKFMARCGTTPGGLASLCMLLIHELCHEEPSSGTHDHTPDFYERYHERTAGQNVARFVDMAQSRLLSCLERAGHKAKKSDLAKLDRTNAIAAHTQKLGN